MRVRPLALAASLVVAGCGSGESSSLFQSAAAAGGSADSGLAGAGTGATAAGGGTGAGAGGTNSGGDTADGRAALGGVAGTGASGDAGIRGGSGGGPGGADSGAFVGTGGSSTSAATPNSIYCGSSPCAPPSLCCAGEVGGIVSGQCLPAFPGCVAGGAPLKCDDAADCPGGQVCCGSISKGSACSATCSSGGQLCRTDAECQSGACKPVSGGGYSTCQ